jgi:hypothetical protein
VNSRRAENFRLVQRLPLDVGERQPCAGVPGNAPRWIMAMTGLAVEKSESLALMVAAV